MTTAIDSPSLVDSLPAILALYDEGQCLDAWKLAQRFGPVDQWPGIEPRILAGRLVRHLGAGRLSMLIHLRLFRGHPHHATAQYYHLYRVHERRGALAAWRERQRFGAPPIDDAEVVADYHGQCAQLLGSLRDFERAEHHLALAREARESRPYWYVERTGLFLSQDKYPEALAATQEGLARFRRYPPLVTYTADCLQLLGRADEALDILRSAAPDSQSSYVVGHLIRFLMQRRLHDEIPAALARFEGLTPLREKALDMWLTSARADVAMYRGDYTAAMESIEHLEDPYHKRIGENLRAFFVDPARHAPRRVEIPVPFVRQHHLTCAPATLTAVSQFWNRPAEHLSVAEEICYDGTPDYSERNWANANGWKTKEFRVDWSSARAVIDRGIPFTLTTSDVAAGHLQAAMGYDEPTCVLLVRDPTVPHTIEINLHDYLAYQASSGPRGMALVPTEHASLLDDLHLPDDELYDLYHEVQLALDRHDRARARESYQRLITRDPAHRLTHTARRAIAVYDENVREDLAATDALLALFPNDQRLEINRLKCLRQLSTRADRLAWLETACANPRSDALLWLEYAIELRADHRRLPEALHQIRRVLRRRPDNPEAIRLLADLEWQQGHHAGAAELYRFASCLSPMREDFAQAYFAACRWQRQIETGLAFLRARYERMGTQSGQPAMSVFCALEDVDRGDDAFTALEAAIERRPDDGVLRLFAATKYAQYGRGEASRFHLDASRGGVKHAAWLAEAAREARLRGEHEEALGYWREILESKPLDLEAHRMTSLLLSETATRDAAIEHLQNYCTKFPHHTGLHRLLYHWRASDPATVREPVLRKLIEIDRTDAWSMRELALNLKQQSHFEEALEAANEGLALEASHSSGQSVRGHVLKAMGRFTEAAVCFRAAITQLAATTEAIQGLLDVSGETLEARSSALGFVQSQLETQPVVGDGVLSFRAVARAILTPDELLAALRRLYEQRPDLWQAGTALVRHLTEMGGLRTEEALALARRLTERFATIASVWLELAFVHRARLEPEDEIAALARCHELSPEWIDPVANMGDALERAHRLDESREVFEAAIKRSPLSPDLRVRLAHLIYRAGEKQRAVQTVRHALQINPESDWGWQVLANWSNEGGAAAIEETLNSARAFAESRPREAAAWIRLAELALRVKRPEDALAAADGAVAVNPQHVDAHDMRAVVLTHLRRFRDAEEACRPPALAERAPDHLEGRAAWIDAQRGNMSRAITRMLAVVDRSPGYTWGWAQLVEWHASRNELDAAAEAAKHWAWLAPTYIVPLGWLGDLKQRLGDRDGAKEVFQRAMRLEPDYLFAGMRFFGIQQEEHDFEGAARTLEILRPYLSAADVEVSRIELDAAQSNFDAALGRIRDLCRDPAVDANAISRAIDAIVRPAWLLKLERAIIDVLREPTWNSAMPWLWARVRIRRRRLASWKEYRRLAGAGDAGKRAIHELLSAIAERAGQTGGRTAFGWYLDWHIVLIAFTCRRWRGDDELWAKVGFVLLSRKRPWVASRWMKDWRTRARVEWWMLQNFTIALLDSGRDTEAREVLRHVIAKFSSKTDIGYRLRLWGALGAGLDGDLDIAERLLQETPLETVLPFDRPAYHLAQALVEIERAPRGASLTTDQRRAIVGAARVPSASPSARLCALVRYRIARERGELWTRLRAWRQMNPRKSLMFFILVGYALVRLLTTAG
ncbi:MAG TPA: tetratricopeptide repeat protein [Gemmatimonadaceae bacterium]|jgi:tetratricopeptide (TPR) repeat protein